MQTTTLHKRPAQERGSADYGWLKARYSFSFGEYFDPDHMGFRSLRVMNNDIVAAEGGFPPHPHESMEIFTYIVEGRLAHRDSMGNEAVIQAGDLQYMSAGSGVRHSEFNPSPTERTVLYQIWIKPQMTGGAPKYAEKRLSKSAPQNGMVLLFSGDGREGSTEIRQQADLYFGHLGAGTEASLSRSESVPHIWIQVIEGSIQVLDTSLRTDDGLAVENHPEALNLKADSDSRFLIFRLT